MNLDPAAGSSITRGQHTGFVVTHQGMEHFGALGYRSWDVALLTTFGLGLKVNMKDLRQLLMGGQLKVSVLTPCCNGTMKLTKKRFRRPSTEARVCSNCGQKVNQDITAMGALFSHDKADPITHVAMLSTLAPNLESLVTAQAGVDTLRAAMLVQEGLALVDKALRVPWGELPGSSLESKHTFH